MASTLTYDPSDDPTFMSEEEARDQESYAIGEELEQQQQQLLAGKYRDAEELEQAYIELQRKLGSRQADDQSDEDQGDGQEEEPEAEEPIDTGFLTRLAEEADSGEFSAETIEALESLSAADIADMFLAYREKSPQAETHQLTPDDISQLKGLAGGEEEYMQMISWASQNLSPEEISIYDSVMDRGDPEAIWFAIQALNYRFKDSVGYEGNLLTGNAPSRQDVFRSQAEVVRAMNDPRYENDPAYRQDVYDKLERSNIAF